MSVNTYDSYTISIHSHKVHTLIYVCMYMHLIYRNYNFISCLIRSYSVSYLCYNLLSVCFFFISGWSYHIPGCTLWMYWGMAGTVVGTYCTKSSYRCLSHNWCDIWWIIWIHNSLRFHVGWLQLEIKLQMVNRTWQQQTFVFFFNN